MINQNVIRFLAVYCIRLIVVTSATPSLYTTHTIGSRFGLESLLIRRVVPTWPSGLFLLLNLIGPTCSRDRRTPCLSHQNIILILCIGLLGNNRFSGIALPTEKIERWGFHLQICDKIPLCLVYNTVSMS